MKDTITVKRANVILDISPDQKSYYLNQGYDVIDDKGNVVEETTNMTIESLNRKVIQLQNLVKEKDEEIAKLRKSNNNTRSKKDD